MQPTLPTESVVLLRILDQMQVPVEATQITTTWTVAQNLAQGERRVSTQPLAMKTAAVIMSAATTELSTGRMGTGQSFGDWNWTQVLHCVVMSVSMNRLYTSPSTYLRMVRDWSVHLAGLSVCLLVCPTVCSSADSSVLCFIQWTDNLTAHFQKQWETIEGKASFQYIGTSTGLLRFYPGTDISEYVLVGVVKLAIFCTSISASDWSLLNRCDRCLKTYPPVDSYDARSRPW